MVSEVMTLQVFGASCVAMAVYLDRATESVTSLPRVCVACESVRAQLNDNLVALDEP